MTTGNLGDHLGWKLSSAIAGGKHCHSEGEIWVAHLSKHCLLLPTLHSVGGPILANPLSGFVKVSKLRFGEIGKLVGDLITSCRGFKSNADTNTQLLITEPCCQCLGHACWTLSIYITFLGKKERGQCAISSHSKHFSTGVKKAVKTAFYQK